MKKSTVIGFIRYSCRAGFIHKDFFLPEYIDYRLNIFKNITLKSFQEQTDNDFNLFLLHSENLPKKYKDIFRKIEDENLFLHNIYIPDTEHDSIDFIHSFEKSIEYVNFSNNLSINFRIDNDDAIPKDFISRLKYFLKPEYSEYVISMPYVSIIQRINNNSFLKQERYFPSNSMGIAFVTCKDSYKTIMTLGDHGKINQNYNMILLKGRGGIQTINGKNVMNSLYSGYVPSLNTNELQNFLKENNYSDHDFTCLNICKRHQILTLIYKAYYYIINMKKK